MTVRPSGKAPRQKVPKVVGVIASRGDLSRALKLTAPPDYFELRLDHFAGTANHLEKTIHRLRAPLIITARHPCEGGANHLSTKQRHELLRRFLPHAKIVDVELRSANAFRSLLESARRKKIARLISFHDFRRTPSEQVLKQKAKCAKAAGADLFKVATRTATLSELARLLAFIDSKDVDLPLAVMGVGKFGAISRVLCARLGSALIYVSLDNSKIQGQLSLEEWRVATRVFAGI